MPHLRSWKTARAESLQYGLKICSGLRDKETGFCDWLVIFHIFGICAKIIITEGCLVFFIISNSFLISSLPTNTLQQNFHLFNCSNLQVSYTKLRKRQCAWTMRPSNQWLDWSLRIHVWTALGNSFDIGLRRCRHELRQNRLRQWQIHRRRNRNWCLSPTEKKQRTTQLQQHKSEWKCICPHCPA